MTIRELAAICGVSPATVSRSLQGHASVREEVRKKINDAIIQYDYHPRYIKRKKRGERSGLIGVILPAMNHPFAHCLLWEIQNQIGRCGKSMVILPEQKNAAAKQLRRLPLEGVIILGAELSPELDTRLKQLGIAQVMCSALPFQSSPSSVHVDDMAAAYDGVQYLLDLGHRRIGFITDSLRSIGTGFKRSIGCRKAMEDAGIPAGEDLFFSGNCDYGSGFRGAQKLREHNPDITAIFAHSDISALGAISALLDQGLRVPDDISVLGFDGIWAGEQYRPRLTCIEQPVSEIVEKTLDLLIRIIEDPDQRPPLSIMLKHTLRIRESCRRLSSLET